MAKIQERWIDKETADYLRFLSAQDLEHYYSLEMAEHLSPLLRIPMQVTLAELKDLVQFFEVNGIVGWIDTRDISSTCGAPIRTFKMAPD